MKLRRLGPNFYIHVSVSDLYILMIGPHILLYCVRWPIVGIYKSLTDTVHECGNWERGRAGFISGNSCFEFSVHCICCVYIVHTFVRMCNIAFPGPSIVVSYNHWIMSVCVCTTPLLHTVLNIECVTRNIHKKHKRWAQFIYWAWHSSEEYHFKILWISFLFIFIFDTFFSKISPIFKSSRRLNWNLQSPNF